MGRSKSTTLIREIPKDLSRANAGLAVVMSTALDALDRGGLSEDARASLSRIIEVSEAANTGVPVAVAATLLKVSERTARTWLDRGVLRRSSPKSPARVTSQSLAEALRAVAFIRAQVGDDHRLLRYWGEQGSFTDLRRRFAELGARRELDLSRLDEELFS